MHDLIGGVHQSEHGWCSERSDDSEQDSSHDGDCIGIVKSVTGSMFISRTEVLGDQNRSTRRQTGKKAHDQSHDLCRGTAHTGKGCFSDKLSDNDSINSVV